MSTPQQVRPPVQVSATQPCFISVGGFGLWMLIDLFRIPGVVERKNKDIARELMAQYQAMRVG